MCAIFISRTVQKIKTCTAERSLELLRIDDFFYKGLGLKRILKNKFCALEFSGTVSASH